MVCPQKESMIIKASIFLLATLLMFFIATIVIAAQPEPSLYGGPATQEEDSILNKFMKPNDPKSAEAGLKELSHYVRDGCKQNLTGEWVWEKWYSDWIEITYDKEHQVFIGKVVTKKDLGYQIGHVLFKVYFPQKDDPDYPNIALSFLSAPIAPINTAFDIKWLRAQKECKWWWFTGTEYSFDQKTKKKTEKKLILVMDGNRLEYKLGKKAWYLDRVKELFVPQPEVRPDSE